MKKTYIQKSTSAKLDLQVAFGITTKSVPDRQLETKEIFKRDWADQQGDEEYIPTIPVFKAYEQDLEFVCLAAPNTAAGLIKTFLAYIQGGEFSLYDEYTQIGIRCRFVSYDSKAFYRVADDAVVFTIKVKINNPLCYALYTESNVITTIINSPLMVFWDDGINASFAANVPISKTFDDNGHFGIVIPTSI